MPHLSNLNGISCLEVFNMLWTTDTRQEGIKYGQNHSIVPSQHSDGGGHREENEKEIGRKSLFSETQSTTKVGEQVANREKVGLENVERRQQGTPRVIYPEQYDTIEKLLNACGIWWERRYRKSRGTWKDYRKRIEKMVTHPVYPIDLFNIVPDQVVAQLDFIEDEWRSKPGNEELDDGAHAIIKRLKAIKALMRSYGRLSEVKDWNYVPPKAPDAKPRRIPLPRVVYDMMHFSYSTDPYEKRLFQYLMTHGFLIGPRPASELSFMKVEDFDESTGMLTFYQPKVERWRQVPLEPELSFATNKKSMKNWIDIWRPKVETSKSGNFLFLQPNGRPFTEAYMAKQLRFYGCMAWPKFTPYSMRHFAATARLVKTKVQSQYRGSEGNFDIHSVCAYMDHSKISVTQGYTKQAGKLFKLAPFDWIDSLLKFHQKTINKKMKQQKVVEGTDRKRKMSALPSNGKTGKRAITVSKYSCRKGMGQTGIEPVTSAL